MELMIKLDKKDIEWLKKEKALASEAEKELAKEPSEPQLSAINNTLRVIKEELWERVQPFSAQYPRLTDLLGECTRENRKVSEATPQDVQDVKGGQSNALEL